MGIYKVKDRRGRRRFVVSKYWPNGSGRLRMYAPNYRSAQALQTRIESSILDGTWKQLKQELAGGNRTIWTVRSFYERFYEEYCKPRMRFRRRYALSFKYLNAMLGNIPLKVFQRQDLYRNVAQRKKRVKPATENRSIAAISKKVALRAARGVHMGQPEPCAQMRPFDVHGRVSQNCCPRVSYGSPRGFPVPLGEFGSGRERPPLFASWIGNAVQADVHWRAIAWEGRSRPKYPWREGHIGHP